MSDDGRQDYTTTVSLPAGALPQNSIVVVAYFDAEGTTRYAIMMEGATSLATVLGLLDMAKDHAKAEAGWTPG